MTRCAVQGAYAYVRFGNPTCEAAEKAINSIEGGFGSIAFGSGMAAISTTLLTFLHPGDHIVRKYKSYSLRSSRLLVTSYSQSIDTEALEL